MKKIVFLILVLFSFYGFSQDTNKTLSGFWGIPFGSSIEQVKGIMKTKTGTSISEESNSNLLIYNNGTFAGKDVDLIGLYFFKGKFYKSVVSLIPSSEARVFALYRELKDNLTDKYFIPNTDIETYDYPYEKGDGHEITALKLDKASIAAFWNFENGEISMVISKSATVSLFYADSELEKQANGVEKEKNNTDL